MKISSLLLALLGLLCVPAHAAERPNILLIVSDDHGYAHTGFNGGRDIPTPHLDAWDKELVEPAFGPPAAAKKAKPAK